MKENNMGKGIKGKALQENSSFEGRKETFKEENRFPGREKYSLRKEYFPFKESKGRTTQPSNRWKFIDVARGDKEQAQNTDGGVLWLQ